MSKALQFYFLLQSKNYEGLVKLVLEAAFGMKGDAIFDEVKPILDKHFGV